MAVLLQVLLIAGVCAGIGALLHRKNYQAGAAWGLGIGLVIAGLVYWQQDAAIENKRYEALERQWRKDDLEEANRIAEKEKFDADMKNGVYGSQGQELYRINHAPPPQHVDPKLSVTDWAATAEWCYEKFQAISKLNDENTLAAEKEQREGIAKVSDALLNKTVHWNAKIALIDARGVFIELPSKAGIHPHSPRGHSPFPFPGLSIPTADFGDKITSLRVGQPIAISALVSIVNHDAGHSEYFVDLTLTELKPE